MTSDFEMHDVLLSIKQMEYSHIKKWIKDYLNIKIKEFELSEKIIYIIIDNKANMKKVIRLLDDVKHLSCSAYMLQLTVIHTLKVIKLYIKKICKLVKFFWFSKYS